MCKTKIIQTIKTTQNELGKSILQVSLIQGKMLALVDKNPELLEIYRDLKEVKTNLEKLS